MSVPSAATNPIDPDCRDGKHKACIGATWDENFDHIVDCGCPCHEPGEGNARA